MPSPPPISTKIKRENFLYSLLYKRRLLLKYEYFGRKWQNRCPLNINSPDKAIAVSNGHHRIKKHSWAQFFFGIIPLIQLFSRMHLFFCLFFCKIDFSCTCHNCVRRAPLLLLGSWVVLSSSISVDISLLSRSTYFQFVELRWCISNQETGDCPRRRCLQRQLGFPFYILQRWIHTFVLQRLVHTFGFTKAGPIDPLLVSNFLFGIL